MSSNTYRERSLIEFQILSLLDSHGPLAVSVLVGLVRPKVTAKRIETVIASLENLAEVGKATATEAGAFRYRIAEHVREELRIDR